MPSEMLSVAVLKLRCTRFIGGGRGVLKMRIFRPHPQKFVFSRSGVGPENPQV